MNGEEKEGDPIEDTRNVHLDRALLVDTIGPAGASFF